MWDFETHCTGAYLVFLLLNKIVTNLTNQLQYFWWPVGVAPVVGFWLFAPKFWEVAEAYEWYGDTMRWWTHWNTTLCKIICLTFLCSQTAGMQELRTGALKPSIAPEPPCANTHDLFFLIERTQMAHCTYLCNTFWIRIRSGKDLGDGGLEKNSRMKWSHLTSQYALDFGSISTVFIPSFINSACSLLLYLIPCIHAFFFTCFHTLFRLRVFLTDDSQCLLQYLIYCFCSYIFKVVFCIIVIHFLVATKCDSTFSFVYLFQQFHLI